VDLLLAIPMPAVPVVVELLLQYRKTIIILIRAIVNQLPFFNAITNVFMKSISQFFVPF
jgi:hypothetical protein